MSSSYAIAVALDLVLPKVLDIRGWSFRGGRLESDSASSVLDLSKQVVSVCEFPKAVEDIRKPRGDGTYLQNLGLWAAPATILMESVVV